MKRRPKDRNDDLPIVVQKFRTARKKSIQLNPSARIPAASLMEDFERNELSDKASRNLKFMRNHVSYLSLLIQI